MSRKIYCLKLNFLMTEVNSLIQAIFKLDYKFSGYIECRPPCGKNI